jgi:hypothetical protein
MHEYEDACLAYFDHKSIKEDAQVRMIASGIKDSCIRDWITSDCDRIHALTFTDFMVEFRTNYLDEDWEANTCRELLAMTQGSQSFWNFQALVAAKNSLLFGTASYLIEDKLRHQLEAALEPRLAKKCDNEKVHKVVDFRKWVAEVKRMDETLKAERLEVELIMKNNRDAARRNNTLAELSRCANITSTVSTSNSTVPTVTILPLSPKILLV